MDDARLDELAQSIKANGVIQPIVVRRDGDRFQIIAGERRWRAAQKAGLLRVPVVVRDVAAGQEQSLLEMALDREHPARGSEPDRRGARLPAARRRVPPDAGRDRRRRSARTARRSPTTCGCCKLPDEVRAEVASGTLSMGHARALLVADRRSRPAPRRARRHRAAASRCARPKSLVKKIGEAAQPAREPRRRSRPTSTRAPPRIGCGSRSARASASSARDRAAASRSISCRKTS